MSCVTEVYLALQMLGFGETQVAQAYIIESLTKVINAVFAFVPGTIGVYEGGTEIILQKGLGFTSAAGLALALVRKAAIVSWTSIGLLVLTWRTLPAWRRILDRSPRLQRLMDSLVLSNIAHRPARAAVSILGTGVGVAHHLHRRTVARSFARTRTARIKHRRGDLRSALRERSVSKSASVSSARVACG